MNIGNMEIKIESVKFLKSNKEEGGEFITGSADVVWIGLAGKETRKIVPVGCWADTDDDHAEWAAWHEGARIIGTCLGVPCEGDMRGTPIHHAFEAESWELGRQVCTLLRESVTEGVAWAE